MDQIVRVYSIQSLDQFRMAIRRFEGDINEILRSIELKINHTEHHLQEKLSHWYHETERWQDEISDAKISLENCIDDDEEGDCSSEKERLDQAIWHLKDAQFKYQEVKKNIRTFEDVSREYRRRSLKLKKFVENDLRQADAFLNYSITLLYQYLNIREVDKVRAIGYKADQISFAEKLQKVENISQPEGLPYSINMKKYLCSLCFLEGDDFNSMIKYLNSGKNRPAIFDNKNMAEKLFIRDFPGLARKVGGWDKNWEGVTVFSSKIPSSTRGCPNESFRIIIARYDEIVLIHELSHQLHSLVWSETGGAGYTKYMKVKELYTNMKVRGLRPISGYITDDGEYFAYSVEWFFQRPADLNFRDPDIFEFLNTQVFRGMYP